LVNEPKLVLSEFDQKLIEYTKKNDKVKGVIFTGCALHAAGGIRRNDVNNF